MCPPLLRLALHAASFASFLAPADGKCVGCCLDSFKGQAGTGCAGLSPNNTPFVLVMPQHTGTLTSVQMLRDNGVTTCEHHHRRLSHTTNLPNAAVGALRVIVLVRSPFERVVSSAAWVGVIGNRRADKHITQPRHHDDVAAFRAWLRACRFKPQIELAVDMLEGRKPAMVVRTEMLQDDWRKVGAALGLDATLSATHCLASCGEKTRGSAAPSAARTHTVERMYDEVTRDKVLRWFAPDFETFGFNRSIAFAAAAYGHEISALSNHSSKLQPRLAGDEPSNRPGNKATPSLRILGSNHKTGTFALKDVVKAMCGPKTKACPTVCTHWNGAIGSSVCNIKASDKRATSGNIAVLHMARDPYDTVVSGYLYHHRPVEQWLKHPILSVGVDDPAGMQVVCAASFASSSIKKKPACTAAGMQWRDVFTHVWGGGNGGGGPPQANAVFATLPVLTPVADAKETYPQYLNRVPERDGLLAEVARALVRDLASMARAARATGPATPAAASDANASSVAASAAPSASSPASSSVTACLETLMVHDAAAIAAEWRRLLVVFGYTSNAAELLASILSRKQAETMIKTSTHGTSHDPEQRTRLLAIVRELDETHLGGALAQIGRVTGCGAKADRRRRRRAPA